MNPAAVAKVEHRRDLWLAALLAVVGASGGFIMMALTAFSYDNNHQWLILFAGLGGVILAGFLVWPKYSTARRRVVAAHRPEASAVPMAMIGVGGLEALARRCPEVSRVLRIVGRVSKNLQPDVSRFSLSSDGELEAYAFRATQPGILSSGTLRERLRTELTEGMGAGWAIKIHPARDLLSGSKRSEIPALATPPLWPIVASAGEAKTRYNEWELSLGPGVGGDVTIDPQVFPHLVAIASSGGGKSVFLRACIEQIRAIGGQVIAGDGKGSDYASLRGVPGVIAVGRGSGKAGMEYVAAVEQAYRIMQSRQDSAAERKAADPEHWTDLPPVFVVLDEMKSVMKKWKSVLEGAEFKAIEAKVNQILALGREMRVHILFATQDVYDESIPGSWLSNVGMKVSLGRPHHQTIAKAFDESVQGEARGVAAAIDPKVRGRGMVAGVDEDSGASQVVQYQGYLSFSPGEPVALKGLPQEVAEARAEFKQRVSDQIPRIWSRKWFKITEPSAAQVAQEKRTGRELGYVDFELLTPEEIADLQVVNLDTRDERGEIVPDPKMRKYDPDPQNTEYVCHPIIDERNAITDI